MSPLVCVEPMPAAERAEQAAINAVCAEALGCDAPAVPEFRVAVRNCYEVKDHLKAAGYRWEPATKAWWTALERNTLDELQAQAQRAGFHVCLAGARAAAVRTLSAPPTSAALPGSGSPAAAAAVASPPPRSAVAAAASPVSPAGALSAAAGAAAAQRISVDVYVEPLPASEKELLARLYQIHAEFGAAVADASERVARAHRVAVRNCFDVMRHLRAADYQWEPATKAWWTHLEDNALEELQAMALRVGFELRGLAAAAAQASRVLSRSAAQGDGSPLPAAVAASPAARTHTPRSDAAAPPADARSQGGPMRHAASPAPRASPYARSPARVPAPRGTVLFVAARENDEGVTIVSGNTGPIEDVLLALDFSHEPARQRWVRRRPAEALVSEALSRATVNKDMRFLQTNALSAELFVRVCGFALSTEDALAAMTAAAAAEAAL